ncbi:hypothetical protein E4U23_000793 [Claviceps purpurea]|nr:hypothetical protein E4U23_000793 [Claviceps purpurea]
MSAIAVEKVPVVDAEAAVEASGVLTRVGNLSLKLVGYAVLEERELELAEDVIDAAGLLSCVLGKFELIDAAVLEAGFAVEAEDAAKDAAEDATEVAVEAAGILACVLSASPKLVGPVEIMSAIAVEKVSVVDAEASVEASGVLTRVGNLSFKLVGYAMLEEGELEPAEDAADVADTADAAGMLDCELGKLELLAAAGLEAGFAVDTEDAAEDAAEVAPEATDILAGVLSASLELEDSIKLIGAVSVETVSVVDAEAAVEASDAAGTLDCELGKLELIDAAMLEAGFAVDAEDAAEDAAEDTAEDAAEVAVEAAGILVCVLSASPKLVGPVELMSAIAVEKVPVVDAEAAVEASGVLTRVGNLSFKLVGYAVLEERELELAEDAADTAEAAGMLDHELDKLELIAAAGLEAGFAVEAEDDAEVAAEVAVEAGGMLACVLSASPKVLLLRKLP